jgi:hypothetical protein
VDRRILAAILLAGIALGAACGDDDGGGRLVLTTEIDETTARPRNNLDELPATAPVIYATIEVADVDAGETFRFRWLRGDEAGLESEYVASESADDTWIYGTLEPEQPLEPGSNYAVEVYRGARLIETKRFSVR